MSLTYIFAATPWEARSIARRVTPHTRRPVLGGRIAGTIGQTSVELILCGAGPSAAGECARRILQGGAPAERPSLVLAAGLCGALSPRFSEGALVACTLCLTSKGEAIPVPLAPRLIHVLARSGVICQPATGFTDSRIAVSPRAKAKLASDGADIVDMESYPILQAARAAGVPCAVLRAVSDSATKTLPDFTGAFAEDGRLRRAAAARIALGSPVRAVRLIRASRSAMDTLTAALEALFTSGGFV